MHSHHPAHLPMLILSVLFLCNCSESGSNPPKSRHQPANDPGVVDPLQPDHTNQNNDTDKPNTDTCAAALVNCHDQCIDPMTNPDYCGANDDCSLYETCTGDETCQKGRCLSPVPEGKVRCKDRIIDPNTDQFFCGANDDCSVYENCHLRNKTCQEGHCVLNCYSDEHPNEGNDYCEPDTSYACGRYDNDCLNLEHVLLAECINAECHIIDCQEGYILKDGHCIEPTLECCGPECAPCQLEGAASCVYENGQFECKCPDNLAACNNKCLDIKTDENNCGECNFKCINNYFDYSSFEFQCIEGFCSNRSCEPGYHLFDYYIYDEINDKTVNIKKCETDSVDACGSQDKNCKQTVFKWESGSCVDKE